MKLQILFVLVLTLIVFYDGYLKGPLLQIYNYGKILSGAGVIAYLIYSYIKKPDDIYTALDFAQSYLLHKDGDTLRHMNRIFEGKPKPKAERNVSQLLKKKVVRKKD